MCCDRGNFPLVVEFLIPFSGISTQKHEVPLKILRIFHQNCEEIFFVVFVKMWKKFQWNKFSRVGIFSFLIFKGIEWGKLRKMFEGGNEEVFFKGSSILFYIFLWYWLSFWGSLVWKICCLKLKFSHFSYFLWIFWRFLIKLQWFLAKLH